MRRRLSRAILGLAAGSIALRGLLHAAADARPRVGVEASDLQRAMFYHWGLHEHLGWTWAEQLARDGFKPPLWFGGVPLLFARRESLTEADFVITGALILAATALVTAGIAARLAGPTAGVFAALTFATLPGVLGRVAFAGVEPVHALCLAGTLLLLLRVRSTPSVGGGALLALALAAGLLAKWNFAAYAALPLAWAIADALRTRRERVAALVASAAALAAIPFLLWATTYSSLEELAAGARDEPSFARAWGAEALLYYPRALARCFGGPGWLLLGAGLLLGSTAPPPRDGPDRPGAWAPSLLAAASLLGLHLALPHKELRYLLPLAPLLVLPPAALLARAWEGGRARRRGTGLAVAAALLLAWPGSLRHDAGVRGDLLLRPDPDDRGLDAFVRHPSFEHRARNVVTTALGGDLAHPAAPLLAWSFYGRNRRVVLTRGDWPDLTSRPAAFDLERSTHVLVGRPLRPDEEADLLARGFEWTHRGRVELPDLQDEEGRPRDLDLWVLGAGRAPPMRGPGPAGAP